MPVLVARAVARERFSMAMLGVFGAVALVLAAVGLYGVMGYLVSQRTQEIGVRMALGGRRGDIFRLVVGEGLAMTLAGLAAGLVIAFAGSKFIARLLYGVRPTDPARWLGSSRCCSWWRWLPPGSRRAARWGSIRHGRC